MAMVVDAAAAEYGVDEGGARPYPHADGDDNTDADAAAAGDDGDDEDGEIFVHAWPCALRREAAQLGGSAGRVVAALLDAYVRAPRGLGAAVATRVAFASVGQPLGAPPLDFWSVEFAPI